MSEQKYEVVGQFTREQAQQIAELLGGGSVIWAYGHTYPCDGIVVRRAGCACPQCSAQETRPECSSCFDDKTITMSDGSKRPCELCSPLVKVPPVETFPCLGNCGASVPGPNAYCSACFLRERQSQKETSVRHEVGCKLFPDPHDEREPVGPCTCGVGAPDRMPHDRTCPKREPECSCNTKSAMACFVGQGSKCLCDCHKRYEQPALNRSPEQ